jgi:hypothetical protein
MEQMNRIAPQVGSYRFRALTEDEKSRIDKLDQQQNSRSQQQNITHHRESVQARYKFRGSGDSSMVWSPGMGNQPSFRPDEKFIDNAPVQAYPYPPYQSQHPYAPSFWQHQFRQDNQKR